jgi:hypothetical protein
MFQMEISSHSILGMRSLYWKRSSKRYGSPKNFLGFTSPRIGIPALSEDPFIVGIEAAPAPQSPLFRFPHVILRSERGTVFLLPFQEFKEAVIINTSMPLAIHVESFRGKQNTATVSMFGSNAVLEAASL